jgi:hypothetical protein
MTVKRGVTAHWRGYALAAVAVAAVAAFVAAEASSPAKAVHSGRAAAA